MKQKFKEILYVMVLSIFIMYSIIMMNNMSNNYERMMITLIVTTVLLTYLLSFALRNIKIDTIEDKYYHSLIIPLLRCSLIVSYGLTLITIFYFSPYLLYYVPTLANNHNILLFLYSFIDILLAYLFLLTILICFIVYISYIKEEPIYNNINDILIIKQYNDIYYKPDKYLNRGYFYRYRTPE